MNMCLKRQSYSTDREKNPQGLNKALSEVSCVWQTLVDVNQTLRDLRADTEQHTPADLINISLVSAWGIYSFQ